MSKKIISGVSIFSVFIALSISAFGGAPQKEQDPVSIDSVISYLDSMSGPRVEMQRETALIKSRADLESFLSSGLAKNSALSKLSPDARTKFLSSLTFNESGLTGFRYVGLASQLTARQIYGILKLFGAQSSTHLMISEDEESKLDGHFIVPPRERQKDYMDYECIRPHTCKVNSGYICMHSC